MPTYFLLRHGQSTANVDGLIASSLTAAGDAYGLTPAGREQVRRSVRAARAAGTLSGACRILSSPLLRARESAEIAAAELEAEVEIDARLIERAFGDFELTTDRNYDQIWNLDREDPTHTRWGVESVRSILDRARSVLADLAAEAGGGSVLLVTHGDVASVLLCDCAGLPIGRHREVGAMGNGQMRELV